jgi:hypothetical protein
VGFWLGIGIRGVVVGEKNCVEALYLLQLPVNAVCYGLQKVFTYSNVKEQEMVGFRLYIT